MFFNTLTPIGREHEFDSNVGVFTRQRPVEGGQNDKKLNGHHETVGNLDTTDSLEDGDTANQEIECVQAKGPVGILKESGSA